MNEPQYGEERTICPTVLKLNLFAWMIYITSVRSYHFLQTYWRSPFNSVSINCLFLLYCLFVTKSCDLFFLLFRLLSSRGMVSYLFDTFYPPAFSLFEVSKFVYKKIREIESYLVPLSSLCNRHIPYLHWRWSGMVISPAVLVPFGNTAPILALVGVRYFIYLRAHLSRSYWTHRTNQIP